MSKELWIQAYELNMADGMSETEAVEAADERAAELEAARIDAARDWREWRREMREWRNDSGV